MESVQVEPPVLQNQVEQEEQSDWDDPFKKMWIYFENILNSHT